MVNKRKLLTMEGVIFRQCVLLLVFVIQAVMVCQAMFCSEIYVKLLRDTEDHSKRCGEKKGPCCEAEKSSLDERQRNYKLLCPNTAGEFKGTLVIFTHIRIIPNSFLGITLMTTESYI